MGIRAAEPSARGPGYQIRSSIGSKAGHRVEDALIELNAMAVQYLIIHGPGSREYYRDTVNPAEFAALPAVWHDQDDTIYAIAHSRQPSLAHVVFRPELPKYRVPWSMASLATAIDDPARPHLTAAWQDQNTLHIGGPLPADGLVYVHVSCHPGWQATQDGRPIAIEKDALGFMLVKANPAAQAAIELRYTGTTEQRVMTVLSALAWIAAPAGLYLRRDRRTPPASH